MNKKFKSAINQQVAVIGLGRFGTKMTRTLYENGCEVMAIDSSEERTLAVADFATHTVVADASDEATLRRLGIAGFDAVVIAIGENMQASIVCALICKEMQAKFIVAKAQDENHAKILSKIGVDRIVIPDAYSAVRTAASIINPAVYDMLELEEGYDVAKIEALNGWKGRSIKELNVRSKFGVNILTIIKNDNSFVNPVADTVIEEGDKIIIGGLSDAIKAFIYRN